MKPMKEEPHDKTIVRELAILPDKGPIHYGEVTMESDGYFLFSGNTEVEIDTLINEKEFSDKKYEFYIRTPDIKGNGKGESEPITAAPFTVKIIIHNLVNDVHLKSIGGTGITGAAGINGGKGGDGGDAVGSDASGGNGGNGGNGGIGKNGGNGTIAPEVMVTFSSEDAKEIIVLDRDDKPIESLISFGGLGGKGGAGGKGGLNGDKKSRALDGSDGKDGAEGQVGKLGENKAVIIIKK